MAFARFLGDLWEAEELRRKLKDSTGIHEIEMNHSGNEISITWNDRTLALNTLSDNGSEFLLNLDGRVVKAYAIREKDHIYIQVRGRNWLFQDVTDQVGSAGSGGTGGGVDQVVSPMPGSVIKLLVEAGASVTENQPLIIVEAMKMENEVLAPVDAVVDKILVEPGQQVGAGEALITFAQPEKDAE